MGSYQSIINLDGRLNVQKYVVTKQKILHLEILKNDYQKVYKNHCQNIYGKLKQLAKLHESQFYGKSVKDQIQSLKHKYLQMYQHLTKKKNYQIFLQLYNIRQYSNQNQVLLKKAEEQYSNLGYQRLKQFRKDLEQKKQQLQKQLPKIINIKKSGNQIKIFQSIKVSFFQEIGKQLAYCNNLIQNLQYFQETHKYHFKILQQKMKKLHKKFAKEFGQLRKKYQIILLDSINKSQYNPSHRIKVSTKSESFNIQDQIGTNKKKSYTQHIKCYIPNCGHLHNQTIRQQEQQRNNRLNDIADSLTVIYTHQTIDPKNVIVQINSQNESNREPWLDKASRHIQTAFKLILVVQKIAGIARYLIG